MRIDSIIMTLLVAKKNIDNNNRRKKQKRPKNITYQMSFEVMHSEQAIWYRVKCHLSWKNVFKTSMTADYL